MGEARDQDKGDSGKDPARAQQPSERSRKSRAAPAPDAKPTPSPNPPTKAPRVQIESKNDTSPTPPLGAIDPAPPLDSFEHVHAAMLARTNVETMLPRDVDTGKVFTLDRMHAIMKALGDPQNSYRVVHVAGSKGKGSVCEMTASALHGCGCAVGLYTSPHLVEVRERVRINNRMISPEEFTVLGRRVIQTASQLPRKFGQATYFELLTAMAMLYFAEQAVDIAVIEVGMGGTLDATNVVSPDVAVVTSIHLEHLDILGDSLDKIATHKAGIFKNGAHALTAVEDPQTIETLQAVAGAVGSRLEVLGSEGLDFSYRFESTAELGPHFKISLVTPNSVFEHVPVPLKGEPQARNCGLVLAIIDRLRQKGMDLPDGRVAAGLSRTSNHGRLEVIHRDPRIVIDNAHTKESIQALVKAVGSQLKYDSLVVVFGCNSDKDIIGMLGAMSMGADKIIFTKSTANPRSVEPRDLQRKFGEVSGKMSQAAPSVKEAINLAARAVGRGDLILVTGSNAMAGEAKRLLLDKHKAAAPSK